MVIAFMAPTHSALGMFFSLATLKLMQFSGWRLPASWLECLLLALICGCVGGLLPDMDRSSSKAANAGQSLGGLVMTGTGMRQSSFFGIVTGALFTVINLPIYIAARRIEHQLGHRGPIHSFTLGLAVAALYTGVVMLLTGNGIIVWLALAFAYLITPILTAILVMVSRRGGWLVLITLLAVILLTVGTTQLVLHTGAMWQALSHPSPAGFVNWLGGIWQAGSRYLIVLPLIYAGVVSHLAGDGCCRSSVPYLLWPFAYTTKGGRSAGLMPLPLGWRPVPKYLRVKAEGPANAAVGLIATVMVVLLLAASDPAVIGTVLGKIRAKG